MSFCCEVLLVRSPLNEDRASKGTFSQVVQHARQNHIKEIRIKGQELVGTLEDGTNFRAVGPTDSDFLLEQLEANDIIPDYDPEPSGGMMTVLTTALPLVLIFILFLLFMRQLQAGGGKAMSFGKSKAKRKTLKVFARNSSK